VCDTCWNQEVADNGGTPARTRPPTPQAKAQALTSGTGKFGSVDALCGKSTCPLKPDPELVSLVWDPAINKIIYEEAGEKWRCRATTKPNDNSVWSLLTWSEGSAGSTADKRIVTLTPAGDKTVKVSFRGKECEVNVHIRRWPVLAVNTVEFDGGQVLDDGEKLIGKPFDKKWVKGRPEAGPNVDPKTCQSPLCYARNTKISVKVTFDVTKAPTDDEDVGICGKATFADGTKVEWRDTVKVTPASKQVTTQLVAAAKPLPNQVDFYDKLSIQWSQKDYKGADGPDGGAGTTSHLLYVTLGGPTDPIYWTLLDISCRSAQGKTDEAGFVPAAFKDFNAHTDDGNGWPRKGDGTLMSYYLQGVKTSADQNEPSVYSAKGILSRKDGTGRCGGWANLLMLMFKNHGVTSARKYWMIRGKDRANRDTNLRFLVKNCNFIGAGGLAAWRTGLHFAGFATENGLYAYRGTVDCVKQDGAPGQGKKNPQFDFGDHVIVDHGGKLYDPSYGLGPFDNQFDYEKSALDGLGSMANGVYGFNMGDGTAQYISLACSPGFVQYTAKAGDTLASVAAAYGGTATDLFTDPLNADLKSTLERRYSVLKVEKSIADLVGIAMAIPAGPEAVPLQAGDEVRIPRSLLTKPMLDPYYL
jgi:hypothetical protein